MAFVRDIKTTEEAKSTWKAFHKRYEGIGVDQKSLDKETKLPGDHKDGVSSGPSPGPGQTILSPEKKEAKTQDVFVEISLDDSPSDKDLIPIEQNERHTPEFIYFLNNAKKDKLILRSTNQEKLKKLEKAIQANPADWKNSIFQDPALPHLAIGLYEDGLISTHQFFSILDFNQAQRDLKNIQFYRILDDNGQFTAEAKKILLPSFKTKTHAVRVEDHQLEAFRMMLLQLPPSERVFYTHDITEQFTGSYEIGRVLKNYGVIKEFDKKIIRLPFGAEDALGLAQYGEQYVRIFPRLGNLEREDIEYGVKHHLRPAAMYFPNIHVNDVIHGFKKVKPVIATDHDRHHAKVLSATPLAIRQGFWTLTTLFRDVFKFYWSKEIWDKSDFDYRHVWLQNSGTVPRDLSPQQMTELFCKTVWEGSLSTLPTFAEGGYMFTRDRDNYDYNKSLAPTGAAFFVDVVESPQKWLDLTIDPKYFTKEFKEPYDIIAKQYPTLQSNDEYVFFNCQLYFALKSINAESHFPLMSRMLFDLRDKHKIEFKKVTKTMSKKTGSCENAIVATSSGVILNSYYKINRFMKDIVVRSASPHYVTAVYDFKLDADDAREYVALRDRGFSEATALYRTKPTFGNWFNQHPCAYTLLGCTIIGLPIAYAVEKCKKQPKRITTKNEEISSELKRTDSLQHQGKFGLLRNTSAKREEGVEFVTPPPVVLVV
jgi:hypothetical protein